jgi:glutathione S-transferase
MSKPTLYGISGSRALRSIWAAEEVGLDYDHVGTTHQADSKAPEYLAVNPNGRIPALVDGDLHLCESMAINLYLAEKYGDGLMPESAADRARCNQWSVWGISEIEPLQMRIVVQKLFTPEEKRNPKVIAGAEKGLQRPMKVLDAQLAGSQYLLGDAFTIADLNVAAVMSLMNMIQFDYSEHANVQAWADRCYARESFGKAQAK